MLTRTLFASGYGGQIYSLSFDPSASPPSLSISSQVSSAGSAPTFLTQHPTLPVLYTGDEFSSADGVLTAFEISQGGGNSSSLVEIGSQGKSKQGPVHFVLNPQGNQLYSACYSAGALSTSNLKEDGKFDEEKKGQNFVYGGKGQNPERQEGPHAHGVAIDPSGQFLWCTDLGTDQLHAYQISDDRIDFSASVSTTRGSGPRHLIFSKTSSPDRSLLYLVSELANTVSIYEVLSPSAAAAPPVELPPATTDDSEMPPATEDVKPDTKPIPMAPVPGPPVIPKPTVNPLQLDVSILPPNATGEWTAAELAISEDKKFLYVSNRAPTEPELPKTDYLTILALDEEGKVVEGEEAKTFKELGGVGPRHFELSSASSQKEEGIVKMEDGETTKGEGEKTYMAVAFQRTNEVVIYQVEGKEIEEVTRIGGIEGATCVIWKQ
ncbi:lactonase family protein [Sporobolomyces salmoneus]|uniref:lactonase family protein n=1 Tax=Sporobolomyces salmoneus TaxID=183962 RepID=UPI00316C274F